MGNLPAYFPCPPCCHVTNPHNLFTKYHEYLLAYTDMGHWVTGSFSLWVSY